MTAAMFMPRGYHLGSEARFQTISPRSRRPSPSARSELLETEMRSEKELETRGPRDTTGKPNRISSIAHSTPSQPVIIPTRTATSKSRREPQSQKSARRSSPDRHDPEAMSPSMAALLAVASESRATALAIKGDHRRRLMRDTFRTPVSSTSPKSWSILQSPPSPTDTDTEQDKETDVEFEVGSMNSQSTLADQLAMYRSLSSDSIPSLDIEGDVVYSPDSPPMPRTPSSRRARSPRREKSKSLSTSEPLAAGELHPLSTHQSVDDQSLDKIREETTDTSADSSRTDLVVSKDRKSTSSKAASHFKSNLTASLQKLKTAARSISIPTPSVSSVLAINSRLIADKRPAAPTRPKSPLPLTNSAFSPKTLSMLDRESSGSNVAQKLFFSSTPGEEYRPISSSIQLQEYTHRGPDRKPTLDRATAPPIFASSSPPPPILLPGVNSPRPREPRENSNFLRVVVLEMNMRRAGKLGDVAGRARIWISPRPEKVGSNAAAKSSRSKQLVPLTRAEKGMGSEVVTEIAEAMSVGGDDQSAALPVTKDARANSTKPDHSESRPPHRWIAWVAEEDM